MVCSMIVPGLVVRRGYADPFGMTNKRATTNAGVLRLRLEDDGEKQTTASASAEADPYGMTTRKTKARCYGRGWVRGILGG